MCSPPSHKSVARPTATPNPNNKIIRKAPTMAIARPLPNTTITRPGDLSSPSADELRARYLSRLGISPKKGQRKIGQLNLARPPARPKPVILKVPLKQEQDLEDVEETKPPSRSRAVSFDDSVSVHPIPMRKEYSNRIRKELWGDRNEALYSINRNSIEFAFENWDWRQVCEDLVPCRNGELVHPVHLMQQRCTVQRQFFLRMMDTKAAAH